MLLYEKQVQYYYHYRCVLVGLIVVVKIYSGKMSDVLIIGIGSCYTQQETLMREHAVGIAGIGW